MSPKKLTDIPAEILTGEKRRIATVGNFDGCHRGHLALLDTLTGEARKRSLSPLVITFTNHPLSILAPERAPKTLQSAEEKTALLRKYAGEVLLLDFSRSLAAITAKQWMKMMRDKLGVHAIVLGYDNTFGSDGRSLTFTDYAAIGLQLDIDIILAPQLEGCSSSRARAAVRQGDMALAAEILGHPYSIRGTVIQGNQIGRTIGVPTANLSVDPALAVPPDGVYAVMATLPDGETIPAVTDIGTRPSLADRYEQEHRIETHLLDWHGDIYGNSLRLDFITRLREEKKFAGLQELREQIQLDIRRARQVLEAARTDNTPHKNRPPLP